MKLLSITILSIGIAIIFGCGADEKKPGEVLQNGRLIEACKTYFNGIKSCKELHGDDTVKIINGCEQKNVVSACDSEGLIGKCADNHSEHSVLIYFEYGTPANAASLESQCKKNGGEWSAP